MKTATLKKRCDRLGIIEDKLRVKLNILRRRVSKASRERLRAYFKWQAELKRTAQLRERREREHSDYLGGKPQ